MFIVYVENPGIFLNKHLVFYVLQNVGPRNVRQNKLFGFLPVKRDVDNRVSVENGEIRFQQIKVENTRDCGYEVKENI